MIVQQPTSPNDEIDLVELFRALWRQKVLIVGITLLVTALAACYAFLATPYFETRTYLRPVPQSNLDQLNETGIYKLTPEEAINRVASGLSSYDNRLDFFMNNQELFPNIRDDSDRLEQAFAEFNEESFEMLFPDPKRTDNRSAFVGLKLTYPEGVAGASVVNAFVAFVLDLERREIAEDVESLISNRLASLEMNIEAQRANYNASKEAKIATLLENDALKRAQLQDELSTLRDELKTRRTNRIQQLNEAISIAESLGIRKPTSPTAMSDSARGNTQVIRTEVTNRETPLYFMGTEALTAERDALVGRKSDDFIEPRIAEIQSELAMLENNREVEILRSREGEDLYLSNLAELREEAARLKGIKLDTDRLRLVRLDQPALESSNPVKPKKAMILALGLVLGGMIGVFVALVRSLVNRPAG
ncbi:Wzz/FepE/Etk N-terminal domain-containing protein [Pseudomonas stutzeri]|uniref:LPS O-antigen chain length determinant protein WzzB n=1 Tax=Stutzerimonas stutzeri TaxID=316 RepID=UPI0016938086|nr:Wzz/FepE/Etk N-terminal domain-containing protein [Stutzerimonas stutzeri]MCQ4230885.1 Wzz/FepE/Etk N-terminal domain-containing protein [Stutzerimonas stutzeri]NIM30839.1 chain-length determining protein [Stutzerimonas stutzeri]NIM54046.1 chain-length determining protein [Stutzerimonas stutzeri]NIM86352.1 chain-length determining protein [Stutzerimonas stutzeri]NIN80948.1 chain-length determining protein [Stutzerimonas stutzeri]